MTFKIIINKRAIHDIEKAIEYYDNKKQGLGSEFKSALFEYINSLKENLFFSIRYDKVRCLPLKIFPFMIHYTINVRNNTVRIQAILHTSRSPKLWNK